MAEYDMDLRAEIERCFSDVGWDLARAAAMSAAGERLARLPEDLDLPPGDVVVHFAVFQEPGTEIMSDIWSHFPAYCARYSFVSMFSACEHYIGQLDLFVKVAHRAAKEGRKIPGGDYLRIRESWGNSPLYWRDVIDGMFKVLNQPTEALSELSCFESINKLRNCLLHRKGEAREIDVDSDRRLNVSWRELEASFGSHPIASPRQQVSDASQLVVRSEKRVHTWELGDTVQLTARDCQGIAFTLFLFCEQFRGKVQAGVKSLMSSNSPEESGYGGSDISTASA